MDYTSLAIAGPPGSGKTRFIQELGKNDLFASLKKVSTGQLLRGRRADLMDRGAFEGDLLKYLRTLSDEEIRSLNDDAREIVLKEGVILDSRYAVENARYAPHVMKILVTAPIEIRVARAQSAHPGKTLSEIEQSLLEREEWEVETGIRLYRYDYRAEEFYHRIIDTSKHTPQEEVELIVSDFGAHTR